VLNPLTTRLIGLPHPDDVRGGKLLRRSPDDRSDIATTSVLIICTHRAYMQPSLCLSLTGTSTFSGAMGWHPVQHAVHTNILVYVGPAHPLTVAKNLPMLSLLLGCFR